MTWRGGERVLETVATLLPQADLYTLVADRRRVPASLRTRRIRTSWLQRLPGARRYFRWALPLMPWTVERFRFTNYDHVISISHAIAHGAQTDGVPHLCYCLTPMRYAWVMPELYLGQQPWLVHALRRWDLATRDRVDRWVAISKTVQDRIRRAYDRPADVIYPPVDCAAFEAAERRPQDYYLVVAALVPYKRTDLAIAAFNRLRKPLVIIGTGPEERRLRRLAGPTITFVGWQSPGQLARWYAGARALIYPQEEDFGIAAVEAQAAGCPVIAFGRGGATETVLDGETGIWFAAQTVEALMESVNQHEQMTYDPARLRVHARQFDRSRFEEQFLDAAGALVS